MCPFCGCNLAVFFVFSSHYFRVRISRFGPLNCKQAESFWSIQTLCACARVKEYQNEVFLPLVCKKMESNEKSWKNIRFGCCDTAEDWVPIIRVSFRVCTHGFVNEFRLYYEYLTRINMHTVILKLVWKLQCIHKWKWHEMHSNCENEVILITKRPSFIMWPYFWYNF